jgi:uncharacterized DUF497 family protein
MASTVYDFEWDPRKARSNRTKHGIGFEIAASIFDDKRQISILDDGHGHAEERWLTLGCASDGKLLLVVHTWQEPKPGEVIIRIISARHATRRERAQYETIP